MPSEHRTDTSLSRSGGAEEVRMRRAVVMLIMLGAVLAATPSQAAPNPDRAGPRDTKAAPPAGRASAGWRGAAGLTAAPAPGGRPLAVGAAAARGDFNDDEIGDLAVGVPGEDVGGIRDAGAVNVLYGSATGLTGPSADIFYQGGGAPGMAEANDLFGASLAAGDFDHDGDTDLAIGALAEDLGSKRDAGAVTVLNGSSGGLVSSGAQQWTQDSAGVPGLAETGDAFGTSLVTGDFDHDTFADLAVGAPNEVVGSGDLAGAVNVIYGASGGGLTGTDAQQWTQDTGGVAGAAEPGDFFGESLAVGDFDEDDNSDLVVGAPGESAAALSRSGVVHVLRGVAADGLTATGSQTFSQDSADVPGTAESGDFFGQSLAAGDLNGDGASDLAVGVLAESIGAADEAGVVHVLYGANTSGLSGTGSQLWSQDSPDVASPAEEGDLFGQGLAAGDFDGDDVIDLAVGAPGENIGGTQAAGSVNVLYGANPGGLTATGSQQWYQGNGGLAGNPEAGDGFGLSLAAGNLGGDVGDVARDDLAVGVPFEGLGSAAAAGVVQVLYGRNPGGLASSGSQLWSQDSAGIPSTAEAEDGFGAALG